jgi:predicted ribosome quality control (RQC) complex YloA/Tae2 family protein
MNSLEILFQTKISREILVNAKIQKVKQTSKNAFSFELYKQKNHNYLIVSNELFFVTEKNYEADLLTNLGQILRKYLTGQIIQDIRQHEFDRIVEIETKDYLLILELFGNGNIILLNKTDRMIITASEIRSWKDRILKPKVIYKYPPSRINPFKLNQNELKECFKDKESVKVLATDLGFGGEIAEDICEKLKINKKSKSIDVSKLFSFIKNIEKEFEGLNDINERLKKGFEEDYETGKKVSEVEDKLKRIRKKQEEALKKWKQKEEDYRKIGKLMYENYEEVMEKLDSRIKKIEIQGLTIELDLKKSVQKNAEVYFEKAKKTKKKIEGLLKAMKKIEKKELSESKKIKSVSKVERQWYDKFRWITSSDGFLLVAGKDAQTNEQLIRKHMKDSDLVFHTDITGSPFVLIKNPEKKEIPEQTIKEAAEFCGSYSKAWKIGISAIDVYYIKPDHVKKEGGLPTGSFMIYGKRNWVRRIPVRVAIGAKNDEFYFGPEQTVKRKTPNFVIISPGNIPANELALRIIEKLRCGIKPENIVRIIPYGRGELSK